MPPTRSGTARHLWIVIPGLGAQGLRGLQSQGTHIPLGLSFPLRCEQRDRNSDSSLSGVVSCGHPPLGARQMSPRLFQLPRLEVFPSVWQPGEMSDSQNFFPAWNQGFSRCYGYLLVLNCKRGLALPKELNTGSETYTLYF